MLDEADLRHAAGDYVAGDLEQADVAAFEARLQEEAGLANEVAFWQRLRPALREHGRPSQARPPGVGLVAAVRHRQALQNDSAVGDDRPATVVRPGGWTWGGWLVAAAAVGILAIVLGRPAPTVAPTAVVAYGENGTRELLPEDWRAHQEFYDAPAYRRVGHTTSPTPQLEGVHRPWLGVWTRPVQLGSQGAAKPGLQVVRVAGHSPAGEAGLQPGDVLLTVGDCQMRTHYCIMRAFMEGQLAPGDQVAISYWRPDDGQQRQALVRLGEVIE